MDCELLKRGDTLAIIAPAKAIEKEYIDFAVQLFEDEGYRVLLGQHCLGQHNYFSGTLEERKDDLQWALDHPEVKAIICARGGYGCIHLLDSINWEVFQQNPKWLVGFSDVTVLHQKLAQLQTPSLHATMPLNFKENSEEALTSLFESLEIGKNEYSWESTAFNSLGKAKGEIIGGNLTVFTGLIGTKYQPSYKNKILFIEDVGEYLYAIDRNLQQLKNAGIFENIIGVIVGDFANCKDTEVPFGKKLEEIISGYFSAKRIPVAFNFPAGHLKDNRALIFGKEIEFLVAENQATISYLSF